MKRSVACCAMLLVSSVALAADEGAGSAVKVSDPVATAQTQALYRNLYKVAQEGVLFGHQDTLAYGVGWKGDPNTLDSDVYRLCGKFPAVFGWDIGHIGTPRNIDGVPFENMKAWIKMGYAKGGISTVSWHARIPGTTKSAWTRENVVSRVLPGGDMHDTYKATLDQVAAFFADLKGPGGEPIPVIFRPFHEHTGDWFWWGAKWCTPDEYKQLWRFTIDYLRKTKGLHNLITAYSPDRFKDREQYMERYPGDDTIDILGHDNYGAFRSAQIKDEARQALETVVALAEEHHKIAALTETGVAQNAANATWWTDILLEVLKSSPKTKKIAWVLVWRNAGRRQTYAAFPEAPTADSFKAFERDPLTVFLEDLPPMYKWTPTPSGDNEEHVVSGHIDQGVVDDPAKLRDVVRGAKNDPYEAVGAAAAEEARSDRVRSFQILETCARNAAGVCRFADRCSA